ncbi:hypothetical protein AZE42_12938 [Rhizopogon vesiculosus]|uniref:Uncharacterized protein n=1 Tax=Rhizopogon vesiculosus TaxID=180088 RepID=A0A1J8R6L6_9AGAM|nr:hypothetical protein AZE42_12938 [Rhizopogon vesiculosus]
MISTRVTDITVPRKLSFGGELGQTGKNECWIGAGHFELDLNTFAANFEQA